MEFDDLRKANLARVNAFGHGGLHAWSPTEWALAVAGECGEMCNLIKKINRGDEIAPAEVGKEIADTLIYLDLLAACMGFDLGAIVRDKFNEVSERVGSDVFL